MRRALKITGWIILGLAAVAAILVAQNWTLIRNLQSARDMTVLDVAKASPREQVVGCPGAPLPRYGAESPLPASVFDAMRDYSDSQGAIGLIVLVNGRVVGEAYREGADGQTPTFSYSMHKSILGLTYGAAVRDGIIESIDDPIGRYIEEWEDDPRGEIPLRAFLTMSSGLKIHSISSGDMKAMNLLLSHKITKTALSIEAQEAPFDTFAYKNSDSQIAGAALVRALEAKGRGRYADYVSQELWCPLGASNAQLWLEKEGGDPRFYANFDTSLHNWARVGQMIAQGGQFDGTQIIPQSWLSEMITPSQTNPNYGLQVWLGSPWKEVRRYSSGTSVTVTHSEPYLADDVIFFDGFGGQRVYVVPSADLVIARTGDVSMTWDDAKLVNIALEGLR